MPITEDRKGQRMQQVSHCLRIILCALYEVRMKGWANCWCLIQCASFTGAMAGEMQTQDMEISSEGSTPTSEHYTPSLTPQQHQLADAHLPQNSSNVPGSLTSSSASAASKLLSHSAPRTEVGPV